MCINSEIFKSPENFEGKKIKNAQNQAFLEKCIICIFYA